MRADLRVKIAVAYFVLATCALIWPIYPSFGNSVEPRIAGLPWSLTYVLLVIAANTVVLTVLYRSRWLDDADDDDADLEREDRVP